MWYTLNSTILNGNYFGIYIVLIPSIASSIQQDYLREAEVRHRPKPMYMRKQQDISHSMRTILVDWLVEVGEEYRLQNETLCLAVSYIDRFLSVMSVVRAKLQLVGTAAMFIAAKYEEIYPPDVGEFVYITDNTYTKKQVLRMEQLILKVLTFDLCVPTTSVFLNAYPIVDDLPKDVKFMAQVSRFIQTNELLFLFGLCLMKSIIRSFE